MSVFTTALIVSPLSDGKSWVLLENFKYHVGTIESDDIVEAKKGFATDFASVPRIFWFVIPKWGKYGNASVIHDWLYWEQGARSRKEADDIFLEAMGCLDVKKWKMYTMYYAVRWFGGIAWYRNSADKLSDFNRVIDTSKIKATSSSKRPGTINRLYKHYFKKKHNKAN